MKVQELGGFSQRQRSEAQNLVVFDLPSQFAVTDPLQPKQQPFSSTDWRGWKQMSFLCFLVLCQAKVMQHEKSDECKKFVCQILKMSTWGGVSGLFCTKEGIWPLTILYPGIPQGRDLAHLPKKHAPTELHSAAKYIGAVSESWSKVRGSSPPGPATTSTQVRILSDPPHHGVVWWCVCDGVCQGVCVCVKTSTNFERSQMTPAEHRAFETHCYQQYEGDLNGEFQQHAP